MAEQFYTILTNVGKAKIANSLPTGTKINLTTLKVGDSNGTYYNPVETQTDIIHKVYECSITSIETDPTNPNWIVISSAIPSSVGGFMIREAGIYDDANNLIAIGKYPETYKPVASDGSTKELYIKMTLEVTNATSVELKIDPTVILATKKDITILDTKIEQFEADNVHSINTINNAMADNSTYSTYKTNVDANGIFTTIQYKRKNGTLILKSILSGGTTPKYTTRTETEYLTDGTTVSVTRVYSITYTLDKVTSEVLQ
ncbi:MULTISPECIES: phage tail protein [Clostridium]|uniref:Phage tail protein n=1 Tax=Clostridium frigoriphilum TaxID=443253 RepID=A0ABU7UUA1_9CLOT|nr:phage tail protein [Clostridium sp. DSM 17811]MBU3098754.1 phage tail protein [Clostridium sp. DSM 17811]